ncbi:CG32061, partial [Drosophila busckii]
AMLYKILYLVLFVLFTVLHISSHLKPVIQANASIKTINLQLDRKLHLHLGYEYQRSMLWQAVINAALLVIGLWHCQRRVMQSKLLFLGSPQSVVQHPAGAGGHNTISPATEVKLDWLRSRKLLPTTWELFPFGVLARFAGPWLLTFIFNALLNYMQLNIVMRHFCSSPLEVLMYYVRIQMLYMRQLLLAAVEPHKYYFNDALESYVSGAAAAAAANHISYEVNLTG